MDDSRWKYAVVTGAAGSIGTAIVTALAAEDWSICALDINSDGLKVLAERLPNGRTLLRTLDVRNNADWSEAVAEISDWSGGRLDLLINNAAVTSRHPFREMRMDEARQIVDVNLTGVINGVLACLPMLEATAGARIINISSIAARTGWPFASIYSATKADVHCLTEALSIELAAQGISVCDIVPSFVDSGRKGDCASDVDIRAAFRRWGIGFSKPDRVAHVVVKATQRYRLHWVVGSQAKQFVLLARLFPALTRFGCRKIAEGFLRR